MLRGILLYLSGAGWMRWLVTHFFPARNVARRFVAGETLDDALQTTADLNARGLRVSLDYLGESVHQAADTVAVVEMYQRLVQAIADGRHCASISLKLTHLGLDISESLCMANLCDILSAANERDIRVTIDMEGSAYTDTTLRIVRTLRDEHGFDNAGAVIQAMLRRSHDDMTQLAAERVRVRLCKGAYHEPASIAYPDKADVDTAYESIMRDWFAHEAPGILEIATHDERLIAAAIDMIRRYAITEDRYEFQMLYGIRTARQESLVTEGFPVRVYLPFGESWYPYFMRRLAERPANLRFFLRALIGR